ncbi:hypothetical protein DQ04_01461070 [Trypanosoma grayi]|uniref:hypothetical protein n=1 Tax=Trypanosoma grayi TaxID=71804 RepID=UPI0004F4405C|nr:hypothetical protein DQ04_01461070 [Trypanosoma grayi]KEG12736.1 hypothetical protein DQ04_01461070 [Trypanosoma grayi]
MLRRAVCVRRGCDTAAAAASEVGAGMYSERALRIRRRELVYRQLRRLIIPGFVTYGLFVLRPHEGHFLRYLAERRHHETTFNQLFPPLVSRARDQKGTTEEIKARSGLFWSSRPGCRSRNEDGAETESDEARLARRRLLFARERTYADGDGNGEALRPIDAMQRATELEAQREHPPMHLLGDDLQALMSASKAYAAAGPDAGGPVPPVRLEFRDWLFFATGNVVLSDSTGEAVRRLRFLGVCGMMWWEL